MSNEELTRGTRVWQKVIYAFVALLICLGAVAAFSTPEKQSHVPSTTKPRF